MVLQKWLEYGFNGYQVPPTPRAARSARRRVSSCKKPDNSSNNNNNNNQMCAFDLLATVAGKLLQEGGDNNKLTVKETETLKTEKTTVEEDPLNITNICDAGSCNRSFFVSEIISQAPVMDEFSGPSSGITVSDCSEKVPISCKLDENKNSKQIINEALPKLPQVVNNNNNIENNNNNNVKLPFCKENVNLVVRDDDENSSGVTRPPNNKSFKPPSRIGDRRIRRLLASKYWKADPKLNEEEHFDEEEELKPVYRNRKTCYKRQRSLKDYPFKKRRLYELDNFSNSDDVVSCEDRSTSPKKDSIEDHCSLGVKSEGGVKMSGFVAKQNPVFQARDSHVKLKIKSFRVPELFIELPKTATVGSLKRTVMEAVTSILSGELHVGVMLQGKKIRDDDKTLLQTGIDNKPDALGFTLEPNQIQVPPSLRPEEKSFIIPHDMRKPLTRCVSCIK